MARVARSFALFFLAAALWAAAAQGEDYQPDDALPAGAKGTVLALRGQVLPLKAEVLPLKGTVLEIRGVGSELKGSAGGLKGSAENLAAALKDLGAKVEKQEIKIELAADVLFDFDKATLRAAAGPALEKVAAVLKSYPKASVVIDGHTDGKGNDQYNQKLSERRAEAVRVWLVDHQVTTSMTARGWGKRKPVAPNTKPDGSDDPAGRQKNRRVEITVKTG
ncbi:MAG TPA: OmpA family protein [Alphaproteobacteria bacterium]|nr:OmpA family protein [Alphaproteobacteria bacterium]